MKPPNRAAKQHRVSLKDNGGFKPPFLEVGGHSYLFIKSITALVMPMIPVRIVGSGTGANLLECRLGNGVAPGFLLSATFAGSTAPTLNMKAGTEWSGRLYSLKSSPPIVGSFGMTFSFPIAVLSAAETRFDS